MTKIFTTGYKIANHAEKSNNYLLMPQPTRLYWYLNAMYSCAVAQITR